MGATAKILATYRLQFHPHLNFEQAAALTDYFVRLGVSHVYTSPYLQAAPGSTHGYDVVDHNRVDESLGGREGHRRFCRALGDAGLGQVLDVVPNHMAITGPENAWWWDVLENGPSSRYASHFDVDWHPPEARMSNKVLLPVLGDHYGRVLESGDIRLERKGADFSIAYYEHRFPVAPRSHLELLRRAGETVDSNELLFIADALECLPLPTVTEREVTRRRHRNKEVLRGQLERLLTDDAQVEAALDEAVREVNANLETLDDLLERQNYRLAHWRTAGRLLGYRRFFDITTLAGLRIEDETVFADSHRLILQWLQTGVLDGVRIDHPDGLLDPEQYLRRLREAAPDAWIVVEKILEADETLRASWPVQGTTGYEFLNAVNGLQTDPEGERPLTDFYADFTGEIAPFEELLHRKKHLVMDDLLGSDIARLTELMQTLCERDRHYRDFTREEVEAMLKEVMACFPVYRTYVRAGEGQIAEEDRRIVQDAIARAQTLQPEIDPQLFEFLRDILLLERVGELEAELVMRFQQLTGPVMAKGAEDTAFYCYHRLISLNEVGGSPSRFGVEPEAFHSAMTEAFRHRPDAMLTTSTHDAKRSEDVRARLATLSEVGDSWASAVRRWSERNEPYRSGDLPDRNAEYLLYQTLFGAWPIETERVVQFMEKASREAKVHTSWRRPDADYERALRRFIEGALSDDEFRADMEGFVNWLLWPGQVNSLAQTLIKLTAPGVPDLYQGCELWDLSLVDPDNRRPVDFEWRRAMLEELENSDVEGAMQRTAEGAPKLWLTWKTLHLRRRRPELFAKGKYRALKAKGTKAKHAVAFSRGGEAIVVVPRLPVGLDNDWADTHLRLPAGEWENALTGDRFSGGKLALQELTARFPVALLTTEHR